MNGKGFLPDDKIEEFLKELGRDSVVYAPYLEDGLVRFLPFDPEKKLCLTRQANMPPKSIIFPQCEHLFSFEYEKNPADPKKVTVRLDAPEDYPATVIFGARPCDAKGFTIFDRVYIGENIVDPYYRGRREKTVIITIACSAPSPGCFCVATGGSPAGKDGSDLLMTKVDGGYFIEPVTEKGRSLMNSPLIKDGSSYEKEAIERQKRAAGLMKNPFGRDGRPTINMELFDSDEFWGKAVSKCISCGACTFLCPTCYCFNITDEQAIFKGERIRNWDACMFLHFTLEASGHNPRPTKYRRFKNRVGHKFLYYPERYYGVLACCGCGRCIRYCPVSVDISEIVAQLSKSNTDINNEIDSQE
ncbi:MAG TPA: hydrogenase [Deltaproteobacteria bacterium]|nr:hydrogenase [Deltaproteobacteria bacterium]